MNKKSKVWIFKGIFAVLALFYFAAVIKTTFMLDGVRLETSVYRLIPFNGVYAYKQGLKSASALLVNYLGNIAMFFPLGIFLPIFFKRLNFSKTVLLGLLLSIIVEILQYLLSSGYADVDDVIMNALGCAIGAITYFYLFGGRRKSITSYVLSLALVIAIEIGSVAAAWYLSPNLLPDKMTVIGGMMAGKRLDSFDIQLKAYKMSHGEIFIVKDTVKDNDGNMINRKDTYLLSDRAIYAVESEENGKKQYHIMGIDDMIDAVSETGGASLKLWFTDTGECRIVMLEQN